MKTRDVRRTVAATEAAKTFGALIDRVRESGTVYQVESRGQVVAEIAPPRKRFTVSDFRELMARIGPAPSELVEAVDETRRETRRAKPAHAIPLSGRGGRKSR